MRFSTHADGEDWAISSESIRKWLTTLAAIIALIATYYELRRASNQIEGSTLYQIARDARELTRSYQQREKANDEDALSFFHSVFQLYQRDVIDEQSWGLFCRNLKNFIGELDNGNGFRMKPELYDSGFISLTNKMQKGESACN